jgi:hypothetical protein
VADGSNGPVDGMNEAAITAVATHCDPCRGRPSRAHAGAGGGRKGPTPRDPP